MKILISAVSTFSEFFLVCELYKTGLKILYYIFEVSRYTNIVYIGVYLVLTYISKDYFQLFATF